MSNLYLPESHLAEALKDKPKIQGLFTVTKFAEDSNNYDTWEEFLRYNKPYEQNSFENGLLNVGITALMNMMIGNGTATAGQFGSTPTYFAYATCCIGVGNSSTAENATYTGLQGTSVAYAPMQSSSYPSINVNVITYQASFGGTISNFAWNEFSVYDHKADTVNSIALASCALALNRAANSPQGTKASGSTWQVTYQLTIS